MAGIKWGDVESFGRTYSLAHLHPVTHNVQVKGNTISLEITFGFHVFTDEKQSGCKLTHKNDERYFCPDRHAGSLSLENRILTAITEGSYVTAFTARQGQRYYHLNAHDDFILMEIRKPNGTNNCLRLHVVSAYTLDQWGRGSLPRGENKKFDFILSHRLGI
jgi:hypothetical protein